MSPLPRCAGCGATGPGGVTAPALTRPTGPPAVRRPRPVSERRTTTVLFGDLVGFTTLSESRDPEDVRELLSEYFQVARTVVGRYGGTIEKFIGDAVMAVGDVPMAHEDDAEQAMRAGLVTGPVSVTLGAVNEGMVAREAVNTAARVQAAATPGAVWVDQETRGLTAAGITFPDMGEHGLKGKAEPARGLQATDRHDETRVLLESARNTFRDLGAAPSRAEVDALEVLLGERVG